MSIAEAHDWAIKQLKDVKRDLSLQEQQGRQGKPRPSCSLCDRSFRWRRPRYDRFDGRPSTGSTQSEATRCHLWSCGKPGR
jgi:hypothetical protein